MKIGNRLLWSFLFLLTACAAPTDPADDIGGGGIDNVGCEDEESKFWNSLYRTAENGFDLPTPDSVEKAMRKKGSKRQFSARALQRYSNEFMDRYRTVYASLATAMKNRDRQKLIEAIVALETGDPGEGAELSPTQAALSGLRQRVKAAEEELDPKCENKEPETPKPPTVPAPTLPVPTPTQPSNPDLAADGALFEQLRTSLASEVFGARKTVTTAYQSCETLGLRALRASDPDVKGIQITGRHPSGGNIRVISSLRDVQKTHYYIANTREQAGAGCTSVLASPLIYDFGGKPLATSSNPSHLNLFGNAGSGSKALGIDCSGYIFTSLATAGLKLDPDTEMKAIHVNNIPARRYMTPSNGMRCFETPKMTATLSIRAGDIAATTGHIIMVDLVRADPLGLARATKSSDCTTSKLSSEGFDFVISQSSPSKDGIGINRIEARDYFRESEKFKDGFEKVAVAACQARYGSPVLPSLSDMALVRHKRTAACKTTPFTLGSESCLYTCPRL